jgi:hypothetical protein
MVEKKYFLPTWILFLILILGTILTNEIATYFLDLNHLLYKNLSEQLTLQQIEKVFELQKRWDWLGYALLPLILFLKVSIISMIIAMGGFFSDIELRHGKYFRIVLLAEFVLLIPTLIKTVWFYFFKMDFSLDDVQEFMPFSLQNIVDNAVVPDWALYPLQVTNLVEVIYWILMAYLLNKYTNTEKGMKIVFTSYVPALLIWIVFIMFITLNITA